METDNKSLLLEQPLAGGGGSDDAMSTSSQLSSASLLERIRAQQNRQTTTANNIGDLQQPTPPGDWNTGSAATTSSNGIPAPQIQVPQYSPVPTAAQDINHFASAGTAEQQHMSSASDGDGAGVSGLFSNAWSNISDSLENGMASISARQNGGYNGLETSDGLLAPTNGSTMATTGEPYSITNYFLTFVKDMQGLFLALPVLARVLLLFALVYVAFKLL